MPDWIECSGCRSRYHTDTCVHVPSTALSPKELRDHWGEPERAPQLLVSIAHACVRACVRVYVAASDVWEYGGECGVRCLRTSTVLSKYDREYIHDWNEATCTSSFFRATLTHRTCKQERRLQRRRENNREYRRQRAAMENKHKGTRTPGAAWHRGSDHHEEDFRS